MISSSVSPVMQPADSDCPRTFMSTAINVLILEDQPSDAKLMVHELWKAGFAPDWHRVETESEFIAHLNPALHLILADYNLPQFDALSALDRLLEHKLDIPFIIVSGTIGEELAVTALKQGAADYLLKDRLARLGHAVVRALEQKQLRDHKQKAEVALQQLSGRLLHLQDEERRRIARELHDGTGQNLSALALNLGLLLKSPNLQVEPAIQNILAESLALAEQCSREVRAISYLLHPPLLDELGFPVALNSYVDGFSRRTGIQVDVDMASNFSRMSPDVETTLFRIVQEGLANVHRHSQSPRATIRVERSEKDVTLELRDEGRGLQADAIKASVDGVLHLGVGIAGMRERARHLGGNLQIESGSTGTRLVVRLPLRNRS